MKKPTKSTAPRGYAKIVVRSSADDEMELFIDALIPMSVVSIVMPYLVTRKQLGKYIKSLKKTLLNSYEEKIHHQPRRV